MIKSTLLFVLVALSLQQSFGQEKPSDTKQGSISKNEFNISVVENRLAFKTVADYEKVVNQPSEVVQKKFQLTIDSFTNFTSFAKKQNLASNLRVKKEELSALIKDDFFKTIISPDLTIQIGDYIFRINPTTEKVYVLPVINKSEYKDLIAEKISNKNIQVFSTNDDVLEMLETKNTKKLFCKESGIGGYDKTTGLINVDNGGTIKMEGKIHFNRYGVYFSLFAEVGTAISGVVELTIEMEPVYYKVKCGSSAGPYNNTSGGGSTFNYKKFQSYQGSKNLNKVYFRARFHGKVGTFTKDSNWIEIRVNY